jgi:hypothetical protein
MFGGLGYEFSEYENVKPLIQYPNLKIFDYYVDDFGSLNFICKTFPNASVTVNEESFNADDTGYFRNRINFDKISKTAVFKIKNSNSEIFTYTLHDHEAPDEPRGLAIDSVNENEIEIIWDETYDKSVYSYNIFIYHSHHGWKQVNRSDEIITEQKYKITGLHSGNDYKIRITSYDRFRNESSYSSEIEVKTSGDYQSCCD